MNPSSYLLLAMLIVVVIGGVLIYRRKQREIGDLEQNCTNIAEEEKRVLNFLHGLGGALQKDYRDAHMHRYIVDGIVPVVGASGAALYLMDKKKKRLAPAYISQGCPPLISLPDPLANRDDEKATAVTSYVRLQTISSEHPFYRIAIGKRRSLSIENLATEPEFEGATDSLHEGVAMLVAPLIYADKPLGLLIMARESPLKPFTESDQSVFDSLAEQSSYALGSAMMHREAHAKRMIDSDLRLASEFQRILLPANAPEMDPYSIHGVNYPAKMVSGDYFDYVGLDEDHLGVAIADVSGKGVPASLIMATCRSVLRAKASENHSPSEVMKGVNELIFPDIREDMFVTMAYLVLNRNSDEVRMARAGHNPPLLYHGKDRTVEQLEPVGMALGIDSGGVFERIVKDFTFEFTAGDILLLYTDGVNEALNSNGDEFGMEKMEQSLLRHADESAEKIVTRLSREVHAFIGNIDQSDDITLIAIKKA